MSKPTVTHGQFTIERDFPATPARVFAAFANPAEKMRWFSGPPQWDLLDFSLDFRVGGLERNRGGARDGSFTTAYEGRFHDIVENERIVSTYEMTVNGKRFSVSLATIELFAHGAGTRALFTEQGAFFERSDTAAQREVGWRQILNLLEAEVIKPANAGEEREIVSVRVFDAPRATVFRAWTEAEPLAAWWGPTGFTNDFEVFEPRAGGEWRFVMRGPDGKKYPNHSTFTEVVKNERIAFRHVAPNFAATATFEDVGPKTRVTWRMRFETQVSYEGVKAFAVDGNRQNLDKLEGVLATMK